MSLIIVHLAPEQHVVFLSAFEEYPKGDAQAYIFSSIVAIGKKIPVEWIEGICDPKVMWENMDSSSKSNEVAIYIHEVNIVLY